MAVYIDDMLPGVKYNGLNLLSTVCTLPATTTIGGSTVSTLGTITGASATALAVGLNGATNSAFVVDSSTGSQAAGLKVTGAVAAGVVAAAVISSGANASLTLDAKGTGTLGINTVSATAGLVTIGNTTDGAGVDVNGVIQSSMVPQACNVSATLTASQVASGYITTTSAAAVTMTLPTGTALGTQFAASQGTVFDLYIDNTAGSNTVTVAVGANCIQSAMGGTLTLVSGITGQACFRFMFSSATACTFTRIA